MQIYVGIPRGLWRLSYTQKGFVHVFSKIAPWELEIRIPHIEIYQGTCSCKDSTKID